MSESKKTDEHSISSGNEGGSKVGELEEAQVGLDDPMEDEQQEEGSEQLQFESSNEDTSDSGTHGKDDVMEVDGQEGDHNKHTGESPYHAPGNDSQYDHEGIDLYIVSHNIRGKYVILRELHNQE